MESSLLGENGSILNNKSANNFMASIDAHDPWVMNNKIYFNYSKAAVEAMSQWPVSRPLQLENKGVGHRHFHSLISD